jgi:hypothetical protein
MALIKCKECGNEISSEAKTCPQCGATPKTPTNMATAIGSVLFAVLVFWFFLGGGVEKQAAKEMGNIESQVANDAVTEYNITKKSGNPIDICVHAGMVAAAYLQAKNEPQYQQWKQTEKADCKAAGMPM